MKNLYEHLKKYSEEEYYAFHMPGHKRNKLVPAELPYEIDITEIGDFDDLHHATGILKEKMKRAARVYHAEDTHFLINGSTVGILSAIMGSTKKGDKILVARNCHKSVYNAIFLNELKPVYLHPSYDGELQISGEIKAEDIKKSLNEQKDTKAVVIVSPTYDGVVSDIEAIAKVVHEKNILLIVDEAHGAHFGFHPYFPKNANMLGADIVIHSLHKTLPALTQTALLHMNGKLVNRERVQNYLQMLQSSSPSYILLASIDSCVEFLEKAGTKAFEEYVEKLKQVRAKLKRLKHLQLLEVSNYDYSKIVIGVNHSNITSKELYSRLEKEFRLQFEMAAGAYVLAMTSVADTKEAYVKLCQALEEIDQELCAKEYVYKLGSMPMTERATEIVGKRKSIALEDSIGKISAQMAYIYPPGIPIIVEGEIISKEVVSYLRGHEELGFTIEGCKRRNEIEVWIDG